MFHLEISQGSHQRYRWYLYELDNPEAETLQDNPEADPELVVTSYQRTLRFQCHIKGFESHGEAKTDFVSVIGRIMFEQAFVLDGQTIGFAAPAHAAYNPLKEARASLNFSIPIPDYASIDNAETDEVAWWKKFFGMVKRI